MTLSTSWGISDDRSASLTLSYDNAHDYRAKSFSQSQLLNKRNHVISSDSARGVWLSKQFYRFATRNSDLHKIAQRARRYSLGWNSIMSKCQRHRMTVTLLRVNSSSLVILHAGASDYLILNFSPRVGVRYAVEDNWGIRPWEAVFEWRGREMKREERWQEKVIWEFEINIKIESCRSSEQLALTICPLIMLLDYEIWLHAIRLHITRRCAK